MEEKQIVCSSEFPQLSRGVKRLYCWFVGSWIAGSTLASLVLATTTYGLANAFWWSGFGIALGGLGVYCWRKSLHYELVDTTVRMIENLAVAAFAGVMLVFMLCALSMGFLNQLSVVCPVMMLALVAGTLSPIERDRDTADIGKKIVAILIGLAIGAVVALFASVAISAASQSLRGDVIRNVDAFSAQREHDLPVDLAVAALSLLPGGFAILLARFATRFREFLYGFGFGAMAIGIWMGCYFVS